MKRRPHSDNRQPSSGSNRRGGQQTSIKRRVVRLLLIPSAVAVVLWLVASGYLVVTGFVDRQVASSVRQVSIPAVTGLSSVQQERQLSVAYLTDPAGGRQKLIDQRHQTDRRLSALRSAAGSALTLAPQSIKTRWKALSDRLGQLPEIRSTIDDGQANRQHVYQFYNGLLDAATDLFDTQARAVPDVTATQGGLTATEAFEAGDLMSRAASVMTGALASHRLSRDDYLEYTRLVGAYRARLSHAAPHLQPNVQARYRAMVAGDAWRRLVTAEDALIAEGPWTSGVPGRLPTTAAGWDAMTTAVSNDLIDLTIGQADEVSAQALRTGNNHLLTAGLGSLAALLIAAAAILWAIRQSQVLVDRALSVRLEKLGEDATRVVDKQLPDMLARLRRQQSADTRVELPLRDYGEDEIGQLAHVINRSLQAAVDSAVEEATTRAASTAMLMGIARRPQRPLQRSLRVVESLQEHTDDEQRLAALFDINHGLAQTRRFLENLVILAGGQTGRRFTKPIPVREILLAAIGETRQYQRVQVRRTVEVSLVGSAIASTTHLLAELLDNALAFSPPPSVVSISCGQVPRGVVIEIEDAGIGMRDSDLEHANELLATAPTPDVTVLKDGAQIGLWVVAELAKRSGVQVTLRSSAYGGLLAVVLLPQRMVASGEDAAVPADVSARELSPVMAATSGRDVSGRRDTSLDGLPAAVVGAMHIGGSGLDGQRLDGQRPDGQRLDAGSAPVHGAQRPANDQPHNGSIAATPPDSSPAATAEPPAARPRLPERRPQQHLAPELRDPTPEPETQAPVTLARSAEENRHRLTRYQQGWRAGQAEPLADTGSNDETGMPDGPDASR